MNAFQTIIQKCYGQDKVFYLNRENPLNSLDFLEYVHSNNYSNKTKASWFFYYYILQLFADDDDNDFIHKKFSELKKLVTNMFMSETLKYEILNDFSKIQRLYYGFAKLAHIYKFKKAKVQISTDLCMNELYPNKSKTSVFILLQNNAKYYFSARDLINMFNSNLSNCAGFIPSLIVSKNPYNNLTFNVADLYNIFFFLRWNNYIVPELFQGYFLSNFNVYQFRNNYESIIINAHIKNYIYNSHCDTLYPIFLDMWENYYQITKKIVIDETFPKDKLINIMKPYLHLYYTGLYATNGTYKQCCADFTLRKKLIRFRNCNPKFGRRYVYFKKDIYGKRNKIEEYDLKHINFYTSSINNSATINSNYNTNNNINVRYNPRHNTNGDYENSPNLFYYTRSFQLRLNEISGTIITSTINQFEGNLIEGSRSPSPELETTTDYSGADQFNESQSQSDSDNEDEQSDNGSIS